MLVKILGAVVVGEFLTWLNRALGHDVGATPPCFYFAIRSAGMIDVTRGVGLSPAVNRLFLANPEEVLAVVGVHLRFREHSPGIFDHAPPSFYRAKGEKPATCARALNHEFILANREFPFRHDDLLVEKSVACKLN